MALDFPSSPVNGQVYDNFIYDATKGTWKSLSSGASPNYLVNPTITDAVITATASTPSTIPLTVNGAASQSANLQEWKNSAGIILASVNNVGSISSSGSFTSSYIGGSAHFSSSNSSSANDQFNYVLAGGNDTGTKAVHFVNSSTRAVDGGANAYTIRNDGGPLILGSPSFATTVNGRVSLPQQPSFLATKSDNGNTYSGDYVFNIALHNNGGHYSTSNGRFTAPVAGKYFFITEIQTYGIGAGTLSTITFKKNNAFYVDGSGGTPRTIVNKAADSTYHNTIVLSMVIDCSAGDYVSVFTENSRGMQSHFSGYLIG